jgi:hypothetical protein
VYFIDIKKTPEDDKSPVNVPLRLLCYCRLNILKERCVDFDWAVYPRLTYVLSDTNGWLNGVQTSPYHLFTSLSPPPLIPPPPLPVSLLVQGGDDQSHLPNLIAGSPLS